jgi:hypothetical protein
MALTEGYIKWWRQVRDHPFGRERRRFSKYEAWSDLVMDAAYQDHDVLLRNTNWVVRLKRGQALLSQRDKAIQWGWARDTVRGFLRLLEKLDMAVVHEVVHGPSGGYTVLIIKNYEKFQGHLESGESDILGHDIGHGSGHGQATGQATVRPRPRPVVRRDKEGERRGKKVEELTPSAFDRFWQAYPKKKAKADAERAWKKLDPDPALVRVILAALEAQKQSDEWCKQGGQFIPYPASWLNGGRWKDELETTEGDEWRERNLG